MAYPKEKIDEVLAYLDEGHSARDAERRFGVSRESAARWRRGRDGNLKVGRPRPVKYPFETVRLALGLAYGGHGLRLDEVAVMLGVSAPTISNWKKRYVEGAAMDIPEIDPDEIVHLGRKEMDEMSDEELRRYVHELEVKAYVLEGTVKVLKAGGVEGLGNEEKAALIDARPRNITATELFGALGIPSSSYYYLRSRPGRADAYAGARAAIREEFELVRGSRGYRYIRQRLREREDPIRISGKKVRELMAEEGCVVTYARKRRRYNSYKGEIGDAPGNLVARDFRADAPNRLWLTDVTQFRIPAGKAYLSPVIDCFDGMPVAWTIRERPDAEMANTMLEEACATLGPGDAPVIHSDRGCHYRWPGWLEICERHGLERSMSRKGCSPDNSAMEGFFGRLKNEFFYGRDWEGVSLEDFASQLDGYMRYYRCERIKRSLGWMSPSQYRKSLGLAA